MTGRAATTGLRSGEVAAAAGVNQQTLRYYERRGLLAEPQRTSGGHRLYPADAVTRLRVIKAAQRLGFTLQEVTELLEAGAHRHQPPGRGLAARVRTKLVEVEAKIADLTVIADTLRQSLTVGCNDLAECSRQPTCPLPFTELASRTADDVPGSTRPATAPVSDGAA
ncbi:MerR family transcriptional regulator [Actinomadura darangshiensis]|uniref:MerR family transcriptional regulator n=1 Tax=Actinomadura darangshiensis TaxID=705336 RepID=A0A4R5C308_9ACTN|nr:MerR family transcriptional regulator [Actinomadura darangshiensis]TDD92939.1 MerR family transcriptional regulator [Actinomadura darangshiensis]